MIILATIYSVKFESSLIIVVLIKKKNKPTFKSLVTRITYENFKIVNYLIYNKCM